MVGEKADKTQVHARTQVWVHIQNPYLGRAINSNLNIIIWVQTPLSIKHEFSIALC